MSYDQLLLRASVLSHFDPPWLGEDSEDEALGTMLLQDCHRVDGPDGRRHWAVDDGVRRSVVASVDPALLRYAVDIAAHRPDTAEQWAIEHVVKGILPPLRDVDLDRLRALESVSRWLSPSFEISARKIGNLMREQELLVSLAHIAGEPFVGREEILDALRPGGRGGSMSSFIDGFGGIGKSAILAQHLLRSRREEGALIVYASFDDVTLDISNPLYLCAAIVRQLSFQVDGTGAEDMERVGERVRDRLRSSKHRFEVQSRSLQWSPARTEALTALEDMRVALPEGLPVVIALDTVEQAQRRDRDAGDRLGELVEAIAGHLPWTQVVLAGRAAVGGQLWKEIHIDGLSQPEALKLLEALTPRGGGDLLRVMERVGTTSPLALRLTAAILNRAPEDPLEDLRLGRVGIEGLLYRRLLGHVQDPAVRRLAHPGLTLRRVTPELIRRVLAGPCEVRVPSDERARELFDGLAREAMLVERRIDAPWEVVHRPDVRRLMLGPLTEEESDVVLRIHRAAVKHYSQSDDLISRTEGMYHRLMLGQTEATLEKHWSDDLVPGLIASLEEMPPASRTFVGARVPDLDLSTADIRAAEGETADRLVKRRVKRLISRGEVAQALGELEAHLTEAAPTPELVELLIEALELVGRLTEAFEIALREWSIARDAGRLDQYVALSLHVARLAERLGVPHQAIVYLSEAYQLLDTLEPCQRWKIERLRLLLASMGLLRRAGMGLNDDMVVAAIKLYDELGAAAVRRVPGLMRDLAAEVGSSSPRILQAALRSVGVDPEELPGLADEIESLESPVLQDLERGELGNTISDVLGEAAGGLADEISGKLSDLYASELDTALELEPEQDVPEVRQLPAPPADAAGGERAGHQPGGEEEPRPATPKDDPSEAGKGDAQADAE
jgi:hypothetical protein